MPNEHAELAPSSGYIWTKCTAQPAFIKTVEPVTRDTSAADEGTAAHLVFERDAIAALQLLGLYSEVDINQLDDEVDALPYDTAQMSEDVSGLVSKILGFFKQDPDAQVWIEQRVKLPHTSSLVWGTADCIVWLPNRKEMWVIDLKYGRTPVMPKDNAQLLIYFAGALQSILNATKLPDKMTVCVSQPRVGSPWETFTFDRDYFFAFNKMLKGVTKTIEGGKGVFLAGDHCTWCPALHACPTAREYAEQHIDFGIIPEGPDYAEILPRLDMLKRWIVAVEEAAVATLTKDNHAIKGWSLKRKRGNRRWKNEATAETYLSMRGLEEDDYMPRKMIGIPAAEKLLKSNKRLDREEFNQYITRPLNKPKLVNEEPDTMFESVEPEKSENLKTEEKSDAS